MAVDLSEVRRTRGLWPGPQGGPRNRTRGLKY